MNRRRLCGLIGFPKSGKNTLHRIFRQQTQFPPDKTDKDVLSIPAFDSRLDALSRFCRNTQKHPVCIDFLNCHAGKQSDNPFCLKTIENMRKVSLFIHVLRCFGDSPPSPTDEIDRMASKFIESDLDLVRRRLTKSNSGKKIQECDVSALQRMTEWLEDGKSARQLPEGDPLRSNLRVSELQLLSIKPIVYLLNVNTVDEGDPFTREVSMSISEGLLESAPVITCSVADEDEFVHRKNKEDGKMSPFLRSFTQNVYKSLPFDTFFTTGDTMTHAWSIPKGSTALEASCHIHSDFVNRFQSAKILPWSAYVAHASIHSAEAAMMTRSREQVIHDGDVMIVNLEKK